MRGRGTRRVPSWMIRVIKCTWQHKCPMGISIVTGECRPMRTIWRFMATVADNTCTSWVSIFNEQAEVKLDGAEANDLYAQVAKANENDL